MTNLGNYKGSLCDFLNENMNNFGKEYVLLDSPGVTKLDNYSYIMGQIKKKIRVKNKVLKIDDKVRHGNIFDILREELKISKPDSYKRQDFFSGGFISLISYDFNRYIEEIPDLSNDDLNVDDIYMVLPELIIVKDEKSNNLYEINFTDKLFDWNYELPIDKLEIKNSDIEIEDLKYFSSNIEKKKFEEICEKAKFYVKEGDIFQVNLSQRFKTEIKDEESFLLYKILRKINPSPFASFVNLKEFKLISQSPERLVSLKDGVAETRPIAGTRRIKKDDDVTNSNNESELKLDEKELAEHVMLVDLERNDLGRVAKIGTVEVDEFMVIEKYSHVMHIVSNIRSILKEEKDCFDLIKATFPGGTITGAPKIRSMEIIEELEPTRRGYYTGSIGYIGFSGEMDLNIIIRSYFEKDNNIYFQVGAGIVFDSIPEMEYKETINKARAMILAYKNLLNYR